MNALKFVFGFAIALLTSAASAQTDTTFTYQGNLSENGAPANGSYDLTFTLWSGSLSEPGIQLGDADVNNGVQVVDGNFTVDIDFGHEFFGSTTTWLETEVNGIILSPRAGITPAPASIGTRGIFVDGDNNVELQGRMRIHADDAALRLDDFLFGGTYTEVRDDTTVRAVFEKVNESGSALIDLDPIPVNGQDDATLRVFRGTDTNGEKRVSFFRGNGTSQTSATIGVDGEDSWFQVHGGNAGIATATPGFLLHVNGDAGKPGGGSWSSASDVRLKKNIEPIDNALRTLLRLRGVTFEYIDPDSIHELPGERIGMIAQEVEKVVPDWVDVRDDGFKAVTHRGFEALTVEALRELKTKHDKELTDLRNENESIRTQVESLKQLVEQLASTKKEQLK